MSSTRHKKYLEKRALAAAQRAIARGRSRDDISGLKIQTVEAWKRLLMAVFGGGMIYAGILAFRSESVGVAIMLWLFGSLSVLAAIFGVKRTISSALSGADILSMLEALL